MLGKFSIKVSKRFLPCPHDKVRRCKEKEKFRARHHDTASQHASFFVLSFCLNDLSTGACCCASSSRVLSHLPQITNFHYLFMGIHKRNYSRPPPQPSLSYHINFISCFSCLRFFFFVVFPTISSDNGKERVHNERRNIVCRAEYIFAV